MRLLRFLPAVLLLLCTGAVVWTGLLLPPPGWILEYGLTPGCEPTGRTWTIEGVEFVEIGPGIARIGSDWQSSPPARLTGSVELAQLTSMMMGGSRGDVPGRYCSPLDLEIGHAVSPTGEMPIHWVEFEQGLFIARTEVTNAQFERFDPDHARDRTSKEDRAPVVDVPRAEARAYCRWLSRKAGSWIRLPSESEWEAACRAGSPGPFCGGDRESDVARHAWYAANSDLHAHEVGTKAANAWGIYDMHGNAAEWCRNSWYARDSTSPSDAKEAEHEGVVRGGDFGYGAAYCRSGIRIVAVSAGGWGFRPAFTPPDR